MIDVADYQRVCEIVGAALDAEEQERESLLAALCGGDSALRAQVDQKLAVLQEVQRARYFSPDALNAARRRGGKNGRAGERFGKFELIEELGRGGMGVVYKATDKALGRQVALKLILRERFADDEHLARFKAEGRAHARIPRHPNVVQVYEAGVEQDEDYISMELIEGENLVERQRSADHRFSRKQLVEKLRVIADAVEHIHECEVYHRDLKPENILIAKDGTPHVSDFGLAKRAKIRPELSTATKLTPWGGIAGGTPAYMSPEQAGNGKNPNDRRSDVYSLGALMYWMLTGSPPVLVYRIGLAPWRCSG